MRVERLDYQREFLRLATSLNKTINDEITAGEEKKDMQVYLNHSDCCNFEVFQCSDE